MTTPTHQLWQVAQIVAWNNFHLPCQSVEIDWLTKWFTAKSPILCTKFRVGNYFAQKVFQNTI